MNKQFYPRANRNRLLSGRTPLVLVVLVVLVGVAYAVRMFAPGTFAFVGTPAWKAGTSLTASVSHAFTFTSGAKLANERDALAADNAALTAQNLTLTTQVRDLTALLGTRTESAKGILASVLARPPVAPYDVLIVDQGSLDGVTTASPVFGNGGTPIGVVTDITTHTAHITLYSATGTHTEGWVGANHVPVTLTGTGAGGFETSVPKDAGVQVGDIVTLPGNGGTPIGTITKIQIDPSSPTVVLDMRPYTNPFSLTWVTIAR
ncbi:MAG: Rod shape-determining protein MreC [Parcubacteria group bacterium]|nr:Rod shape-determining protein MreC [Parcubacteria group bacterium]